MTKPGDRDRSVWKERLQSRFVPWGLAFVVLLSLVLPLRNIAANYPYYRHVDEGHLVLWVNSVGGTAAPPTVYYGPFMFYAVYGACAAINPLCTALGLESFFTYHGWVRKYEPGFYNDYRPAWMLLVARSCSLLFFVGSTLAVFAVLRKLTGDGVLGVLGSALFASVPYHQELAAYAQPEMATLLLLSLSFYVLVDGCERGFRGRRLVALALLMALLVCTKVYTIIYLLFFGLVPLASREGRWRKLAFLLVLWAAAVVLLYIPYRSPKDLLYVVNLARHVYTAKCFCVTLMHEFVRGGHYTFAHIGVFALGLLCLFCLRFPAHVSLAGFAALINLLYFCQYEFPNVRNLVGVGLFGVVAFVAASQHVPKNLREAPTFRALLWGLNAVSAILLLSVAFQGLRNAPERDNRLAAADLINPALLPQQGSVFVSLSTQIHSETMVPEIIRFSQTEPPPSDLLQMRSGDLIIVSESYESMDPSLAEVLAGTRLLRELGGVLSEPPKLFIDGNPNIRIHQAH